MSTPDHRTGEYDPTQPIPNQTSDVVGNADSGLSPITGASAPDRPSASIDTTPDPDDPAPAHDNGSHHVPTITPEFERESTTMSDPHTSAAADVFGTGGTAA